MIVAPPFVDILWKSNFSNKIPQSPPYIAKRCLLVGGYSTFNVKVEGVISG